MYVSVKNSATNMKLSIFDLYDISLICTKIWHLYRHLCDCTERLALPVSLIIADNCNALGLIPMPAGRSISVCLISSANYEGTCKVSNLSLFVTHFR